MIKIAAIYKFKRACVFAIVCKMVMARRTFQGDWVQGGQAEASLEVLHKPYLSFNKIIKGTWRCWEGLHPRVWLLALPQVSPPGIFLPTPLACYISLVVGRGQQGLREGTECTLGMRVQARQDLHQHPGSAPSVSGWHVAALR